MNTQRTRAGRCQATITDYSLYATTSSSSRSNTPQSPSPPATGVLDQVFGDHNPYVGQYDYYARMEEVNPNPFPAYVQPMEVQYFEQFLFDPSYLCVPVPDLPQPPSVPIPQPILPAKQNSQVVFMTTLSPNMVPIPSQAPSDLPKRKGDRALARLHRSAVDPDRHWACNQCIQKFARKSDLTRHLKRHAGLKEYPCTAPCCPLPVEERAFFRADARRRHWSKSPACEAAFYKTPEGIAWSKKNGNRRGVLIYREDENEDISDDYSDSTYAG